MAVCNGVVILLASFTLVTGTRTNVAEGKPVWMSSHFDGNHLASRAVDGVTSANDDGSIAHTAIGQSSAWWKVDLQTLVQSAQVILYFRTDYKKRRNGVHLYTSWTNSSDPKEGNLCHTVTGRPDGTNIDDVLNVTCPGTWRYLTVYTDTDNDGYGPILDFAEVQVGICTAGMYGPDCTRNCSSRHCKVFSSTCDHITGTCPAGGCQDGWMGVDCTIACGSGTYGANCAGNCSSRHCKMSSTACNHISGACSGDGCQAGYKGTDCTTVCAYGTYGANCAENCSSRHCKTSSTACGHIRGACSDDGCVDGWMGIDCTRVCASGTYGANCTGNCSSRHCKMSSTSCDHIRGACPNGECEDGWMGTDCTTALLNCPGGRYGPGCKEVCSSRNCKTPSPMCDVTGACTDGCREGWQNADCRIPCPGGTYGSNCSKSCDSRQCKTAPTTCYHESGTCPTGCREGWIGVDCTQRCKPGTYGPDCSRCGYCDVTCNVEDGRCPGECLDGFTGDRCDVDVRDSVVKIGVIGGAIGMAIGMVVMLLLVVGLIMCLLKRGRLKWISSNGPEPKEGRKKGYIEEIPAHTPTPGSENPDYTELNDVSREREEKSPYDVIQNQEYENNII
ncbi:multiple epidermal growth factor-like domains protein 10 isoform X2 [Haliotis asinina]|uniref:multiple epidermal growth factor-like domains protein 10 isoform X2 n=1 Tax=Haliotis asinina TaxID=109174 RepID=UPI0035321842